MRGNESMIQESGRGAPPRADRSLVVGDEPMVAEVVERYLRRDEHEVVRVAGGAAALAAFERLRGA